MIKEKIRKLKDGSNAMRKEIQRQTIGYIIAALGLVAGLAWNDAIKAFIEYIFPAAQNTLLAKLIYALLITLIVVLVSSNLIRFLGGKEEQK